MQVIRIPNALVDVLSNSSSVGSVLVICEIWGLEVCCEGLKEGCHSVVLCIECKIVSIYLQIEADSHNNSN